MVQYLAADSPRVTHYLAQVLTNSPYNTYEAITIDKLTRRTDDAGKEARQLLLLVTQKGESYGSSPIGHHFAD